jgi:hypothetical protein
MLQVGDVVAPKHGASEVEESIAEAVPCAYKRQPGPGVADPIGWEVTLFLKARNCRDSCLAVGPKWIGGNKVELAQPCLKVAYGFAAVTFRERECPI